MIDVAAANQGLPKSGVNIGSKVTGCRGDHGSVSNTQQPSVSVAGGTSRIRLGTWSTVTLGMVPTVSYRSPILRLR
jgi:hypothetical protein